MKCQIQFSGKNYRNINLSSADSAHSMLSVKANGNFNEYIRQKFQKEITKIQ